MNALACLLVSATLAVPAGDEKKAPKDTDKLQGLWQVTAATRNGAPAPNPALFANSSYTLAIVGDRYVFMAHGGTITLDPYKGFLDLQVTAGRYSGKTFPCRYELKDDVLKVTMPMLADALTQFMDHAVIDKTNLKDAYQIALSDQDIGPFILTKFPHPPGAAPNPANGSTSASDPTGGSTIFKTLEKLGLKLERTKAPVEILVVDHLEKSPTEN